MDSQPEATQELPHVHDNFSSLRSYFDISDPSDKTQAKFKDIYEYFRGDKKEYQDFDLIRDLRDAQFKLGTTPMGESRLDQIHRYATLMRQSKQLEEELRSMSR